jgi:hypothetical protein
MHQNSAHGVRIGRADFVSSGRRLDDQDRELGLQDQGLGRAAQQGLADRGTTSGADHQQLGAGLVGQAQDGEREGRYRSRRV